MGSLHSVTGGVGPHRVALAGSLVLLAVEAGLPAAGLLLLERALQAATGGETQAAGLAVGGLVGVTAVASAAKLGRTALSKRVAWRITDRLRRAVHDRLMRGQLDERSVGDRLALLSAETDQIQLGVSAAVTVIRDPLALLGLAIAAVWIAPTLALASAVVLLPVAGIAWGTTRWVARAARATREARADLLGLAGEQLWGRQVLESHDALSGEASRFAAVAEVDRAARWWSDVVRGVPGAVTQTLGVAALGVVLVVGVLRVGGGALSSAAMLSFAAGLFLALRPVTRLAEAGSLYRRCRAALERAEAMLDEPPTPWHRPALHADAGLRLEGARLGDAVGPVSFDVPPGQWLGLVGPTGSGKTTVLRWLAGVGQPTDGRCSVFGASAHALDPSIRPTAYVPQDSVLFARTVGDNAALGAPDATSAQRAVALASVAASHLDDAQPLGADGTPLSGGERQRLALARALLLDRPVWLLDEPTAHLDAHTRSQVVDALRALGADRTVVVATHDAELARRMDRVVVLRDGLVVQDGPPERVLPKVVGS